MIADFLTAFGVVFLAELPDKTMFATLLLSTRFERRSAVWLGVSTAYGLHVLVATLLGGVLSRLPTGALHSVVGALFVTAGAYLAYSSWRRSQQPEHAESVQRASFATTFLAAVATVGVAEFADITQLATASLAATRDHPLAVGVGAFSALVSVSGIAVLAGSALTKRVNLRVIQRAAAVLFVLIGVATLV